MNNMFQMVTPPCYHILLCLVPVCCFINMFTQVTLGFINLKFLFSPCCTDGTQQVRRSSSALHLPTTEEQRVRAILIWSCSCWEPVFCTATSIHICSSGRYLQTHCGGMDFPLLQGKGMKKFMTWCVVTSVSSECSAGAVIESGTCDWGERIWGWVRLMLELEVDIFGFPLVRDNPVVICGPKMKGWIAL